MSLPGTPRAWHSACWALHVQGEGGADSPDRESLERLNEDERQLMHLRIELDFDYDEIAAMTDRSSRDAARMAVQRALRKLAETMGHER